MRGHFLRAASPKGGGGGGWTPADITTELWLDAADAGTITLSGGDVSQWDDKSGNSRHFSMPVAAFRPYYDAGSDAVVFTSDRLDGSGFGGGLGSNWTIFLVFQPDTYAIGLFDSAPYAMEVVRNYASDTWEWWNGAPNVALGLTSNQFTQIAMQHTLAPARNIVYRRDGTQVSSTANGSTAGAAWTATPAIGGINGGDAGFYAGAIHEVIICQNSELTGGNLEKVEGYLAHRPGRSALVSGLPSGHPYKSSPP